MLDIPADANVVALVVHKPDARLLLAATSGKGFVASSGELLAETRKGRQVVNVRGDIKLAVVHEIAPFYQWSTQVRPADRLIVELGNEPNLRRGTDFIQPYADSLHAAIDAVRANFPGVQICSPGIAPSGASSYHDWFWNQRFKDAVNRCDFVGFHFYGATSFDPVVYEIVGALTGHFPGKLWIATEYGLNYAYGGNPTAEKQAKCRAYSDMIHRNGHADIQNQLWGATYFHIDVSSPDPLFQAYNVAPDGPLGYQP